MKYSELYRLLQKNKCYDTGEGDDHAKWYSPITRRYFPVPRHRSKEVRTGTLKNILREAGIKI